MMEISGVGARRSRRAARDGPPLVLTSTKVVVACTSVVCTVCNPYVPRERSSRAGRTDLTITFVAIDLKSKHISLKDSEMTMCPGARSHIFVQQTGSLTHATMNARCC